MVQFFVPLAFAFMASPIYHLDYKSDRERQLTDSTTECIKTTADLKCKAIGSQKTRCAFNNLQIGTSVKSEDPKIDSTLEENAKMSWGCTKSYFCQPFEIVFNETGVASLVMSNRLKNDRISAIWDIANQMNFLWIQNLISNKTSIQEVTTYGECTAEIKTEESNNDERPDRNTPLFETGNFVKSGMVTNFKKIRDVDSCSKGKSKVSDAGNSSLKSFVHTVSISEYKFKSCTENEVQLSFTDKSLSDKYKNCLSVDRIETSSSISKLPEIDYSAYVSVPFLSA
ncbi:uncharacterized protein LOC130663877 [Microplitis mediator]|uniref:uncharacterized protein LOC130663877 n=1 Tax=Microplitis mediator TaxID=375433 RepID=UPI0025543104|nr:uncharacterized protein LOC130663877 [Microplitis mediator]